MTRSRDNATNVAGDISGITAGVGLSGGGLSGNVTVTNSMATAIDQKADLVVGTAADTFSRLAVGTNNHTLIADSSAETGLSYAAGSKATLTTTGDMLYASSANTPARIGIGSNGQVLTVASGIPSWAAPSSGAMTFITSGTFTTASSVSTAANTFTSTYANYFVMIDFSAVSQNVAFTVRMRASGTDTTSGYEWAQCGVGVNGTVEDTGGGGAEMKPFNLTATTDRDAISFYISTPQLARGTRLFGVGFASSTTGVNGIRIGGANHTGSTQFDAFTFYPSTGTISGTYRVYGIANS